jgi:hypothetical protein
MNNDALKPDALALQTTVIDWLKEVSKLMTFASTKLGRDDQTGKYARKIQAKVDEQCKKVEKMELVMVIAAPMKAGKSTIINSLIGMDLLPHRSEAMTTLPTEVVFGEEKEPILTLTETTLKLFQKAWEELHNSLRDNSKRAQANKKIEKNPQVKTTLDGICKEKDLPISQRTLGRENIIKALTTLNDLVRLCSFIEDRANPLPKLAFLPRIETRLWQSLKTDQSEEGMTQLPKGKLVIVDTPGPDEAGQHKLADVVKDQLNRSAMVLLILNFTGLNTKAADQIKKDVEKLIGSGTTEDAGKKVQNAKEKLYVLVNKMDQRQPDRDMNDEQLDTFIHANLELQESSIKNQIFKCSAKRAFAAASFVQELQHTQANKFNDMSTSKNFAEAMTNQLASQNILENETIKEVQKFMFFLSELNVNNLDNENKKKLQIFSEDLWDKSGFKLFLKDAINVLIKDASPKLLNSAITTTCRDLEQLNSQIIIRELQKNQEKFKEIKNVKNGLSNKISKLGNCRSEMQSKIKKIKYNLWKKIFNKIEDMRNKAQDKIEDEFQKLLGAKAFDNPNELAFLVRSGYVKSTGIWQFESQEEAEKFVTNTYENVKQNVNGCLQSLNSDIYKIFESQIEDFYKFLKAETDPILQEANSELKKAFGKEIELSPLELENVNDDFINPPNGKYIEQESKQVYEEKLVYRRTLWHWFFLVPKREKKIVRRTKKEWIVTTEDIFSDITRAINESMEKIKDQITEFMNNDFKGRVDVYFEDINSYFSIYQDSLSQTLEDKNLDEIKKNELINNLTHLQEQAKKLIENGQKYSDWVKQLEKKNNDIFSRIKTIFRNKK